MPCIDAETSRLWSESDRLARENKVMPCSDGGQSTYESERKAQQIRLDMSELEAMLCSACRSLEAYNYMFDINPMLARWWDKHKKEDEVRIAAEAKRAREIERCRSLLNTPLAKLTQEDKQLLRGYGYY